MKLSGSLADLSASYSELSIAKIRVSWRSRAVAFSIIEGDASVVMENDNKAIVSHDDTSRDYGDSVTVIFAFIAEEQVDADAILAVADSA